MVLADTAEDAVVRCAPAATARTKRPRDRRDTAPWKDKERRHPPLVEVATQARAESPTS